MGIIRILTIRINVDLLSSIAGVWALFDCKNAITRRDDAGMPCLHGSCVSTVSWWSVGITRPGKFNSLSIPRFLGIGVTDKKGKGGMWKRKPRPPMQGASRSLRSSGRVRLHQDVAPLTCGALHDHMDRLLGIQTWNMRS